MKKTFKIGDRVQWEQDFGSSIPLILNGTVNHIDGEYANINYNNINGLNTNSDVEISRLTNKTCAHIWEHGYTLDLVVFCTKCNKDADEVYEGMTYKQQRELVENKF